MEGKKKRKKQSRYYTNGKQIKPNKIQTYTWLKAKYLEQQNTKITVQFEKNYNESQDVKIVILSYKLTYTQL